MTMIRIPERNRIPGACYAVSQDGVELPVVDVTHPAFKLLFSEKEIARLREQDARDQRTWMQKPAFLRQFLLFMVRRRSVLMQSLKAGEGAFLSGMNTYLMKLGADNLGNGYTKPLDRRIAARVPLLNVRFRLQSMAQLIAEGLRPALEAGNTGPVHLVNIAGGPSLDSLNALILIRKQHPILLAERSVRILVLDPDEEGPAFGARALAALVSEGAPLQGLDIAFEHLPYDWNRPSSLGDILASLPARALAAGSSEGGLFEYGSDETILANLEALRRHGPSGFTFSGSMSMDLPHTPDTIRLTGLPRRTFSLEGIRTLANRAGWMVEQVTEGPTTLCVRLAGAGGKR